MYEILHNLKKPQAVTLKASFTGQKKKKILNISVLRCRDNGIKTLKRHVTRAHSASPPWGWLLSFPGAEAMGRSFCAPLCP